MTLSISIGFARCAFHSRLQTLHHIFFESICCHGNDWNLFSVRMIQCTDFLCGSQAIHYRHHNIHKNCIKSTCSTGFKQFYRLLPIRYNCNFRSIICNPSSVSSTFAISAFNSLSSTSIRCKPRIAFSDIH